MPSTAFIGLSSSDTGLARFDYNAGGRDTTRQSEEELHNEISAFKLSVPFHSNRFLLHLF